MSRRDDFVSLLWDTVTDDLPPLIDELNTILSDC